MGIISVAVAGCVSRVGKHAIRFAFGVAKRLTEAPVDLANVFDGVLGQRTIRDDGEFPPLRIARGWNGAGSVELDCGFDLHGFILEV